MNQATSDRYAAQCSAAESTGDLASAEEACYRSVKNVDWGNLGPELKSQRLYNLARIKRRLAKFAEAEEVLKESLAIEETLSGPTGVKIGRRLVELSVNLAGQNKWSEGEIVVSRFIPISTAFVGQERTYTKEVLLRYAATMDKLGNVQSAEKFKAAAAAL
ncbi:tetratricopeptide repeat protein [Rhodoferax sp.]|uniref:tetratricopeptide repeat protein n=1 Tax=Rhodoferax sp. TaxID=50421 RepID=UPI0027715FA8|nr:tetratricopeptide repeat protein [Rhodoferax sp.]